MYSDLLDVLGNSAAGRNRNSDDGKQTLLSFKAGKMDMELQENGKYMVTPDTRKGSIQLVWANNALKWEWFDRREKTVVDTFAVDGGTFERVDTGKPEDRVYLWENAAKERKMWWMQDKSDEKDDENVASVNEYLANPADANPNPAADGDSPSALDPEALMQVMQGVNRPSGGGSQVDALSNILENLGMPPAQQAQPQGDVNQDGAAGAAGGGTLTLADLQGAMQGIATANPSGPAGPPLSELVTPGAISSLLENESVCNRLMELLPETQRTREHLEENLRSPQVSQTLRSLTAALMPDEGGSMDGYHSVLANFQLDPKDGEAALRSGNPLQAFLDCLLASVQKEEGESKEEERPMEE